MKKLFFALILSVLACAPAWAAPYILTGDSVAVADQTIDKAHYEVQIFTHRQSDVYEVYLDVWPQGTSVIGSFSASEGSIKYYFSGLVKNNTADYFCEEDSQIELTITRISEDSCELSAFVQAARKGVLYSYQINTFRFKYQSGDIPPEPEEDPYRFEPEQAVASAFNGQIVSVYDKRETTGWINIHLSDSLNQKWDWIELDWVSDEYDMPVGTYTFSADSAEGTFIASPGYRKKNDYPSYVAIRGEEWGQYTPYYIQSGSLTFSLNEKGDTVYVEGQVTSQHGSTFDIHVKSYNEFYYEPTPPKPKEEKELMIDSVSITYMREESDSLRNRHKYTFNFSYRQDFPNVMFDAYMPQPGTLTEGVYSMANDSLKDPILLQNQEDFEEFFFFGDNYAFDQVSLTLTEVGNEVWEYQVDMHDTVGSHYYFTLRQKPDIIIYPEIDPIPEEDIPYIQEDTVKTEQELTFRTMLWDESSVAKDGVIEIELSEDQFTDDSQKAIYLGMIVSKPVETGTYPVSGKDSTEIFMASLGYQYDIQFPSFWYEINTQLTVTKIWYITSGEITITVNENGDKDLEGTIYSHFGSSLTFKYTAPHTDMHAPHAVQKAVKVLHNGRIMIEREGRRYSILGE